LLLSDFCMGCLHDVFGNIHIPRRLVQLSACETSNFVLTCHPFSYGLYASSALAGQSLFRSSPTSGLRYWCLPLLLRQHHCHRFSPLRKPDVYWSRLQMGQYIICLHSATHEPCTNCTSQRVHAQATY
jgi:hypothetical protein